MVLLPSDCRETFRPLFGYFPEMGYQPRVRFAVTLFVLLCGVLPARHAQGAPALERGVAITDPLSLRELDRGRFGLTRIMRPTRSSDAPLTNSQLFAWPSMVPVRKALDDEFDRYILRHNA